LIEAITYLNTVIVRRSKFLYKVAETNTLRMKITDKRPYARELVFGRWSRLRGRGCRVISVTGVIGCFFGRDVSG